MGTTVNHNKTFISVGAGKFGSVDDQTAIKHDDFLTVLRNNPMYRDAQYKLFQEDG